MSTRLVREASRANTDGRSGPNRSGDARVVGNTRRATSARSLQCANQSREAIASDPDAEAGDHHPMRSDHFTRRADDAIVVSSLNWFHRAAERAAGFSRGAA